MTFDRVVLELCKCDRQTDRQTSGKLSGDTVVEFGEAIKNPAYRILQTDISGCLDSSAHA